MVCGNKPVGGYLFRCVVKGGERTNSASADNCINAPYVCNYSWIITWFLESDTAKNDYSRCWMLAFSACRMWGKFILSDALVFCIFIVFIYIIQNRPTASWSMSGWSWAPDCHRVCFPAVWLISSSTTHWPMPDLTCAWPFPCPPIREIARVLQLGGLHVCLCALTWPDLCPPTGDIPGQLRVGGRYFCCVLWPDLTSVRSHRR